MKLPSVATREARALVQEKRGTRAPEATEGSFTAARQPISRCSSYSGDTRKSSKFASPEPLQPPHAGPPGIFGTAAQPRMTAVEPFPELRTPQFVFYDP